MKDKTLESRKYVLTKETIKINGATLHRIKAVKDLDDSNVKVCDLGGFIATEANYPTAVIVRYMRTPKFMIMPKFLRMLVLSITPKLTVPRRFMTMRAYAIMLRLIKMP